MSVGKLLVKKKQNNSPLASGKFYQRTVHITTIEWPSFIEHIREHGACYSRGTVNGVMQDMVDCLIELCGMSYKVRLADLGTFYMSTESDGGESVDQVDVNNVRRVHLRFTPNLGDDNPLDSVSLKKRVSLLQSEGILPGQEAAAGAGGSTTQGDGDSEPVVENPGG